MEISVATLASVLLVATAAVSLTAVEAAAAAPAARLGGAGGGGGGGDTLWGLCAGSGTSARTICSLCDPSRSGHLYDACCSQRRAFEMCAAAAAAAAAAGAASPQRYVGGGSVPFLPLPNDGDSEAYGAGGAAGTDKRYGRMGFGRPAPLPQSRTPRGPPTHQSAKRANEDGAWSIEQSNAEAAAPWYDGNDEGDDSYYYDYRDYAGGAGDDNRDGDGDADDAANVGYDQLGDVLPPIRGDSLLDLLGGGNEKRFGNLGMRGGR